MITYAMSVRRSRVAAWVFLVAGLLLLSLDAVAAEDDARLSITTQGEGATEDVYPTLRKGDDRTPAMSEARNALAANVDFWFYAADVELFNDHDGDGFYHGIDVWFDADTYYSYAEVYAVLYLSLNGGPWNEYAVTDNFVINGTSADDDYIIVTELISGYPAGSYDLLIELFDTYDGSFVAWIGPDESPELAFLPLEDSDRDVAEIPEVIVVHERGGGGATGVWFSLCLLLVALVKRRRERCS